MEEATVRSSQESLGLSQDTIEHIYNLLAADGTTEQMLIDIDDLSTPPVPSTCPPPGRSSLPATSDWPGDFDFNVTFSAHEKANSKQMNWIYSEKEKKLYVKKDMPCPINFSTNMLMLPGMEVRAMAVFTSPESASEAVSRCVNHSMAEIEAGLVQAEHLIRSESSVASYRIDEITKRHSVIVPFENPAAGQSFSTYIYKFVCFSSCAGGPNRRPLTLVFTLEKNNVVVGRRALELKICACPGRDSGAVEKSPLPMSGPSKKIKISEPASVPKMLESNFMPKLKSESDAKHEYTIKVRDYECYKFLRGMKKMFELNKTMHMLPNQCKVFYHVVRSSSDEEERS